MDPAGTVRVGLRTIEFRTLAREILADPAPGKIAVMTDPGNVIQAPDNLWVEAKPGDRLFFVQGVFRSRDWAFADLRNAIATLNLSTGASYIEKSSIAHLAVPPFHNFFGIISVFVAVFSLLFIFNAPQGIVFLIPSAGYLFWVRGRIKKVRRAVEVLLAKARAEAPA